MPEVITMGETMVLLNPLADGPLRYVERFSKTIAGAESNFAIALAKLGYSTGWIGQVGNDEFGQFVLSVLRGEKVDLSTVKIDKEKATGVFFRERKKLGQAETYYYRKNSAASNMGPSILQKEYFKDARFLHLTGITPALSKSCLESCLAAIKLARKEDVRISFDPNIRFKLWSDADRARQVIKDLIREVDIVLPGLSEAKFLFAEKADEYQDKYEKYAKLFLDMGPDLVVLKDGSKGAFLAAADINKFMPVDKLDVVDSVGAGDAFAAGFIGGLLEGKSRLQALKQAQILGAFATTVPGDIEALPSRKDLQHFINKDNSDILR